MSDEQDIEHTRQILEILSLGPLRPPVQRPYYKLLVNLTRREAVDAVAAIHEMVPHIPWWQQGDEYCIWDHERVVEGSSKIHRHRVITVLRRYCQSYPDDQFTI